MPTAHHEDEPRVTPVVDGLRSSGHADGPAPEVLGHLANVHDGVHPAGEGLQTDGLVDAVFLAELQGAPDSVTVMKCGTRGAREVGLDCSNEQIFCTSIGMESGTEKTGSLSSFVPKY